MTARTRLTRELKELEKKIEKDIQLKLTGDTFEEWEGKILGPPESPYQGYWFELHISCTSEYPLIPPMVKFVTPVFHPNVNFETGEICLDILTKEHWSPAWNLLSICRAIISLLSLPNALSPLNCDAGNLLRLGDLKGFYFLAKMYTIDLAKS